MKRKSATHMPLLFLIYIIGLSLGLFLLQAVPYRGNVLLPYPPFFI